MERRPSFRSRAMSLFRRGEPLTISKPQVLCESLPQERNKPREPVFPVPSMQTLLVDLQQQNPEATI